MNTQKMLLKAVYCLAGILFLASVGFNIFQYQQSQKLSARPNNEENAASGSGSVTDKNEDIRTRLDNAKKELRKKNIQLSEERAQKEEYLKTRESLSAGISDYSNPAEQKRLREILSENFAEDYNPMFKKLNIAKNDFELLKDMLIDREMKQRILMENYSSYRRSAEEEKKIKKLNKEIQEKYEENIRTFLGEEKNKIYESYEERLSERRNLQNFFEIESPDQKLTEDQIESLIDSMYAARKSVSDKKDNDDGRMTEDKIAKSLEWQSRIYKKYLEAVSRIMEPKLAEKFENYLKQQIEMHESLLKMSLYLNDKE